MFDIHVNTHAVIIQTGWIYEHNVTHNIANVVIRLGHYYK